MAMDLWKTLTQFFKITDDFEQWSKQNRPLRLKKQVSFGNRRLPNLNLKELVYIMNHSDVVDLRRKPLPPGFCYICSRLDPDGRYNRQPYEYLYNKGFFSHCEHQPRVPFPTFVEDEKEDDLVFQKESSNPDWNLSVQVTMKQSKRGFGPAQQDQGKYSKKYFDKSVLKGVPPEIEGDDPSKYKLPPVFDPTKKIGNVDIGKIVPTVGEKTFEDARPVEEEDDYVPNTSMGIFINQIETGEIQLPPLTNGALVSKNDHDNLDAAKESVAASPVGRKKARGVRRKKQDNDELEEDEIKYDTYDEDGAGHLKYHHRNQYDSVPQGGFEMAPSRDTTRNSMHVEGDILTANQIDRRKSLQSQKSLTSQHSLELKGTSNQHDSMKVKESPSMVIHRINDSGHWCGCNDTESEIANSKCPECLSVGFHEKWCVHATSDSRLGVCPKCGKPIKRRRKSKKLSRTSKSEDFELSGKRPSIGEGSTLSGKEEHHVRFEDLKDDRGRNKQSRDPRRARSENFMDYKDDDDDDDDLMFGKQKRAWSPGDDEADGDKATPYPNVDPNIHRNAYAKAIEAKRLEVLKKIRHIDTNFIADRLSKPHVFSYFKLRPQQQNALPGGPDNIGIMPPKTKDVMPRKAMSHIFGKIKVEDFYPGGKKNPRPNSEVTISVKQEKLKQTVPVHTWKQER